MAAPATLPALLTTLSDSLATATGFLPSTANLTPPSDGISLLDTKNELLLSYLHNLTFLIILKLRHQSSSPSSSRAEEESSFHDAVTKKLVELRIYLEKGVRPLESRLKYQLDKLLLAASEASIPPILQNGTTNTSSTLEGGRGANSDTDSDAERTHQPTAISDLAHRPNPSAFARPAESQSNHPSTSDGVYRPPRITPTALPTTEPSSRNRNNPKPRKSQTLNEFIREEMDDAPIAEPSIGAGSGLRGKEREREEERRMNGV